MIYVVICGYYLDNSLSNRTAQIRVHPDKINDRSHLLLKTAKALKADPNKIEDFRVIRRSIDARKQPIYQLLVEVALTGEKLEPLVGEEVYPSKPFKGLAVIIGAGPAGLFAALRLLENGVKPIVIERGKSVRDRRRDLARIFKDREVDPDSNYCFGEGGAGTYSDGKLYTRSKKRGDVRKVLETFVRHGASEDILINAHPHIGTNKLPGIIEKIRESIIEQGGEVHFETRLIGLMINNDKVTGVETNKGKIESDHVILATGHSARDVFRMLEQQNIRIESKPFALGVRIEHHQDLIDQIQYSCKVRHPNLPPASYRLVTQAHGRGVFSFCMCPGGIIAPAMTGPKEIVVNGWSPSKRNGAYANSGFVVEVVAEDWKDVDAPEGLKAMTFQAGIEHKAFLAGGGELHAPAQRIIDYIHSRPSKDVPDSSYLPGIVPSDLREVLPDFIGNRIREALKHFGKRMKGFTADDAIMVGVESRTSSPVSIPRDPVTLQHPEIRGLYPCGEGAGYAGGIVSAALDGYACAVQIATEA